MSDIVKRLRAWDPDNGSLMGKAAAEIEHLRARVAELECIDASRCETGLPCERLAAAEAAIRADERARTVEECARAMTRLAGVLHNTIDHETAHGKDMGEYGRGYQAACDDFETYIATDLRALSPSPARES